MAISADQLAEVGQTNQLLEEALTRYSTLCLLSLPVGSMETREKDAEILACRRLAERYSFRGWSNKAIDVLTFLSERYPKERVIHHDIGMQLLMIGQQEKAKELFQMVCLNQPLIFVYSLIKVFFSSLLNLILTMDLLMLIWALSSRHLRIKMPRRFPI